MVEEGLGDLELNQFLSGRELFKLGLSATAETAWEKRGTIAGLLIPVALTGLTHGVAFAGSEQDGVGALDPELIIGGALVLPFIIGFGNAGRVYAFRRAKLAELQQSFDAQEDMIDGITEFTERDWSQLYTMRIVNQGEQPTKEGLDEFIKLGNSDEFLAQEEKTLSGIGKEIWSKKMGLIVELPREFGEAMLTTFYFEGFIYLMSILSKISAEAKSPLEKVFATSILASSVWAGYSLLNDMWAIQGAKGSGAARNEKAIKSLRKAGFLAKEAKANQRSFISSITKSFGRNLRGLNRWLSRGSTVSEGAQTGQPAGDRKRPKIRV